MPIPGWMVQTILYVPRRRMVLLNVPERLVLEWNFAGPLRTVTLCGSSPTQRQRTVVPLETVFELGRKTSSSTRTVVAANAGIATATATEMATASAASARNFFMCGGSLEDGGLAVRTEDLLQGLDDLTLGRVDASGVD